MFTEYNDAPFNDFSKARFRPVTLKDDLKHYFVGSYDEKGFKGLVSIHDTPLAAIEAAERLNATN